LSFTIENFLESLFVAWLSIFLDGLAIALVKQDMDWHTMASEGHSSVFVKIIFAYFAFNGFYKGVFSLFVLIWLAYF